MRKRFCSRTAALRTAPLSVGDKKRRKTLKSDRIVSAIKRITPSITWSRFSAGKYSYQAVFSPTLHFTPTVNKQFSHDELQSRAKKTQKISAFSIILQPAPPTPLHGSVGKVCELEAEPRTGSWEHWLLLLAKAASIEAA